MPKRKRAAQASPQADSEEETAKTAPELKDIDDVAPLKDDFKVPYADKTIICEKHGSQDIATSLIFTHGAGGGLGATAVQDFAKGFAAVAPVICFKGNMNLKSRVKMFHAVVENQGPADALGGRSMGARAAVMAALELEKPPAALLLISYPLTAGGKEQKRQPEGREQILMDLPEATDVLFVSGDQDSQCDLELLAETRGKMKAKKWLVEVAGADHGMNVKPKSAIQSIGLKTGQIAAEWLSSRDKSKQYCRILWEDEEIAVACGGWQEGVADEEAQRSQQDEGENG
ncbi:hypothetical protein TI39_contig4116g00015 [Zymoseptoria brevis]|uniref:KANL3/Tex30 alpha/beta hydrolase-like domain-containing protein n=1 Tax=Zymoseptoria brevis TaxID=1047168 RepID=A0A0F4GEH8_9PEZI|nr:hypothetical protein TI39_contig4116g00015 [Zymoseptoria brevis]